MRYFLNNTVLLMTQPLFKYYRHIALTALLLVFYTITGCKKEASEENAFLALTTMKIEDPVRHYYPVAQGVKQNISVKITNTGKQPLKLYKVLPSCGCTIAKFPNHAIAPGEEAFIDLEYNSTKNIGYVGVYTTITANTKKHYHTAFFDINVVPDALYTKDYEELYQAEKDKEGGVKDMVDGEAGQKGYEADSTEVHEYIKKGF
jgi:hypothetical protein